LASRLQASKVKDQARPAALGAGEDELFERKMSKEEKKAAAKAAREAKRKLKQQSSSNVSGGGDDEGDEEPTTSAAVQEVQSLIETVKRSGDVAEEQRSEAAEQLAQEGTIVTFSASRKGVDARSRDVNIQNVTLLHKGLVMLDETEIVLNHGNRYGLIGRNGVGKSTLMKALGARAVPIPSGIDIFHLKEEIEPSDTITALEAVMSVDEERARLEMEAEKLNSAFSLLSDTADDNDNDATIEEQQEQITDLLNDIYERLDALDAETAETRARAILKGLGFTHSMQSKLTKDFSGGWRMRVSLARALFIQPTLLLLGKLVNFFLSVALLSLVSMLIPSFFCNYSLFVNK
jgi:ATP-binding cassette subfamily F protein 2